MNKAIIIGVIIVIAIGVVGITVFPTETEQVEDFQEEKPKPRNLSANLSESIGIRTGG